MLIRYNFWRYLNFPVSSIVSFLAVPSVPCTLLLSLIIIQPVYLTIDFDRLRLLLPIIQFNDDNKTPFVCCAAQIHNNIYCLSCRAAWRDRRCLGVCYRIGRRQSGATSWLRSSYSTITCYYFNSLFSPRFE